MSVFLAYLALLAAGIIALPVYLPSLVSFALTFCLRFLQMVSVFVRYVTGYLLQNTAALVQGDITRSISTESSNINLATR